MAKVFWGVFLIFIGLSIFFPGRNTMIAGLALAFIALGITSIIQQGNRNNRNKYSEDNFNDGEDMNNTHGSGETGSASDETRQSNAAHADGNGISAIIVNLSSATLTVTPHDENDVRHDVTGQYAQSIKFSFHGGEYIIEQKVQSGWRPGRQQAHVNLYIPRLWRGALTLKTVSGRIDADGIFSTSCELETVSGHITADRFVCTNMKAGTTSGNLRIARLVAKRLEARGISGDIMISGDVEQVKASQVSGNIRLTLGAACKNIDINSISGDATLQLAGGVSSLSLRSVSGGKYGGDAPRDPNGPTVTMNSVSGSVRLKTNV